MIKSIESDIISDAVFIKTTKHSGFFVKTFYEVEPYFEYDRYITYSYILECLNACFAIV